MVHSSILRPVTAPARSYEIHEVARLTGLSPARLRQWERRHEIVRPRRQANGYRAYSGEQVALLRALARLVGAGHRIGDLVERPRADLLAAAEQGAAPDSPVGPLLAAVQALDREAIEALVAQQLALRGLGGFVREVAEPLAQAVGDRWALGQLPVAAEHMASEVMVHALKGGLRIHRGAGPVIVAACLPGERHEWGVLGSLALAQERGWRAHYLGADLPLEDVVQAAWALGPAAVALSAADPQLVARHLRPLAELPSRLPPRVFAVAGGAGMHAHERVLRHAGYRLGLDAFRHLPAAGESRRAAH